MKAVANLLLLSLVHFIVFLKPVKAEQAAVKALYVFGDSFLDNGNNNYIEGTDAKSDYPPYGVDFPVGPTGRFTNGRNPADVLAEHLGIAGYLPPFNNNQTKGDRILHGVNYASAGAGIFDTTWVTEHIIPLSHQVENFLNVTLPELEAELNDTSYFMSHAIFMFLIGGNDYNYLCFDSDDDTCDFEELTSNLIGNYSIQLQKLYDAGARKFVLYNLQPSGCNPTSRIQNDGACVKEYNDAMVLFNNHLNASLDDFMEEMPGSVFVYVNTYNILSQVIDEPASFGIEVINASCCYVEGTKGITCEEYGSPCSNRSIYLYYDRVHPTEKVYNYLSTRAYLSNLSSEVHPINVKTLANITFNSTLYNVPYKLWPVEVLNNEGFSISGQEELRPAS
ncbi:GDSL esterase/lipase [Nymphaea thermarum]|nr:GDSL esterase/lipase [Nymphaea thermarum]